MSLLDTFYLSNLNLFIFPNIFIRHAIKITKSFLMFILVSKVIYIYVHILSHFTEKRRKIKGKIDSDIQINKEKKSTKTKQKITIYLQESKKKKSPNMYSRSYKFSTITQKMINQTPKQMSYSSNKSLKHNRSTAIFKKQITSGHTQGQDE